MCNTTVGVEVNAVNSNVNVNVFVGENFAAYAGEGSYSPAYATGRHVAQIVVASVAFAILFAVVMLAIKLAGVLGDLWPAILAAMISIAYAGAKLCAISLGIYAVGVFLRDGAKYALAERAQRRAAGAAVREAMMLPVAVKPMMMLEDKQAQPVIEITEKEKQAIWR